MAKSQVLLGSSSCDDHIVEGVRVRDDVNDRKDQGDPRCMLHTEATVMINAQKDQDDRVNIDVYDRLSP